MKNFWKFLDQAKKMTGFVYDYVSGEMDRQIKKTAMRASRRLFRLKRI